MARSVGGGAFCRVIHTPEVVFIGADDEGTVVALATDVTAVTKEDSDI